MIGRFLTEEERAQRKAAYRAQYNAIRSGRLKSPRDCVCVDCGRPASEYDHHISYEPVHHLSVEPVCQRCHYKRSAVRHQHNPKGVKHPAHAVFTGSSAEDVIAHFLAWRSALEACM